MLVDFHIHTTNSDGEYSPEILADFIDKTNLLFASFTDHDFITVPPVTKRCQFIQGIEITAQAYGRIVHILGYNFSESDLLKNMLQQIEKRRRNFPLKLMHALRSVGVRLQCTYEEMSSDFLQGIAECIVKNGYACSTAEAHEKYLDRIIPQIQLEIAPSASLAIEAINLAKGISLLAHPTRYYRNIDDVINCIKGLMECGIKGIECYHPYISRTNATLLISYAKKNDLYISGGSDFHRQDLCHKGPCGVEIEDKYIHRLIERI